MAEKGFDPEVWLNKRFEIFKKYCFPSVINQSNLNFTWMIYIDSETSEEMLGKLNNLFAPFPFIILIQREFPHFSLKLVINEDVREYFDDDFQFLISSRLDTDDMLYKDFFKELQSKFNRQNYKVLNFNRGLIYDVDTGILSKTNRKNNPFISLIESKSDLGFKTVYHRMHFEYEDEPEKLEIDNPCPMWCMCVHGLNVSTSFYGSVYKFYQPDLKELFGFEFQKTPSLGTILRYTFRSYVRKWKKIKSKLEDISGIRLGNN